MELNKKNVVLASLAFGWITVFWFGYDNLIQTVNIATFGLRTPISGAILAIDNIIGLLVLPLFGWLSDRSKCKIGRRTPFILGGTLISMVGLIAVGVFALKQQILGYIIALVITLVGMAVYRPAALALVPDVTPEPLRTKANAISNIVSALFNFVGVAIVTPFLTVRYIEANNYLPIVLGIVLTTIVTASVFVAKTREQKLLCDLQLQLKDLPAACKETNECSGEVIKDKSAKRRCFRNKTLILLTVVFFYMAYNALVSNFSNFACYVLDLEFRALPLIVITGGALAGFALTSKVTARLNRKRTIILGFCIMIAAFLCASTLITGKIIDAMPRYAYLAVMNVCFAVAGFGYGFVMVNVYPLFLQYSNGKLGKGTGIYASAMTVAMVITPILSGVFIERLGILTGGTYSTTVGNEVITNYGDYRALIPYSTVNLLMGLLMTILVKINKTESCYAKESNASKHGGGRRQSAAKGKNCLRRG